MKTCPGVSQARCMSEVLTIFVLPIGFVQSDTETCGDLCNIHANHSHD